MSQDELPNRRTGARFLTDLELEISDASGRVIDAHAQAHDVSPKGFRAETKTNFNKGDLIRFSLQFEDEEPVTGQAEVVWNGQNPWGWYTVGVKITKLSWRDSRRLAANIAGPRYNFAELAGKAMKALWWLVLVAGLNAVIFHQSVARRMFVELIPVMIALFFLGLGLLMLFRRE